LVQKTLLYYGDMDSLEDILGKRKSKEPYEITAIKQYIYDNFKAESQVGQKDDSLIITVSSSSLANTLRFQILKLQAAGNTTKHIMFRIS
jgi:hypothetical protein